MASWAVSRLAAFEHDLDGLKKAHYRKNRRDWDRYMQLVETLLEELSQNPFADSYVDQKIRSYTRRFPKGYALPDRLLAYAKFRMPGLSGSAEYGRIVYETVTQDARVIVLVAYNHSSTGFGRDLPDSVAAKRLDQGRIEFPDS